MLKKIIKTLVKASVFLTLNKICSIMLLKYDKIYYF